MASLQSNTYEAAKAKKKLYQAVVDGDICVIEQLASDGWDVFSAQWEPIPRLCQTALSLALHYGHSQCARYLLDLPGCFYGCDIHELCVEAARSRCKEILQLLIEKWMEKQSTYNSDLILPILSKSKSGHFDKVKNLIKNKSVITCMDILAGLLVIHACPVSCLKALARHGADFTTPSSVSLNPIACAILSENMDCLQYLLEKQDQSRKLKLDSFRKFGDYNIQNAIEVASSLQDSKWLITILSSSLDLTCLDIRLPAYKACIYGNSPTLEVLFNTGCNVTSAGVGMNNYLLAAMNSGVTNCVRKVLETVKRDFFEKTLKGIKKEHVYGLLHNVECLKVVLNSCGYQVDSKSNQGETLLMMSSRHGCLDTAVFLLENQANINHQFEDSGSALSQSCLYFQSTMTKLLIERGATVDLMNQHGNTALMNAASVDNIDCLKILLEAHADINLQNSNGCTAVMKAVEEGSENCVKLLIEAGADLDLQLHDGKTAVMMAVEKNKRELLNLLLDAGASVDMRDKWGQSALMMVECSQCLKMLVDAGADVNIQDLKGNTPLIQTLHLLSDENLSSILLKAGADTNIRNEQGLTALMYASCHDRTYHKMLLDYGANVNLQDNEGNTALVLAVKKPDYLFVSFLLREGADPELANHNGETFLSVDQSSRASTLKAMVSAGLGPTSCVYQNIQVFPLVLAFMNALYSSAKYFIQYGYFFRRDYSLLHNNEQVKAAVSGWRYDFLSQLLEEATLQPLSLQTWSFITVSEAITLAGPPAQRAARVDNLPLPDKLKKRLKFEGLVDAL